MIRHLQIRWISVILFGCLFPKCVVYGQAGDPSPATGVREVISRLKTSLETKDIDLFSSCLSPTQMKGIEEQKRNLLETWKKFSYSLDIMGLPQVNVNGASADAELMVIFSLRNAEGVSTSMPPVKMVLQFREEDGRWKISDGRLEWSLPPK